MQESFWLISTIEVKDYEEYVKEYGSNKPVKLAVTKMLTLHDLIGTLLYKKLIDIDLVHLALSINATKVIYKRLSPILPGIRKGMNEPVLFVGFDYLVSELTRKEPQLRKDVKQMMERSKMTSDKKDREKTS